MHINVNQNLTWEFEPLISSGIELSGHSIMFIIYNDLYDANPNDKKEKPLEMKWQYQNVVLFGDRICTHRTSQGYYACLYLAAMESC